MSALPYHLWAPDLDQGQLQFLERFCAILDRACEEVAFRWCVPLVFSRVYPARGKPYTGTCVEIHTGDGPAGVYGQHRLGEIHVWLGTGGPGEAPEDQDEGWRGRLTHRLSHEVFESMVNPDPEHHPRTYGPYTANIPDPVCVTPWMVRGPGPDWRSVPLSNFVYPSYYSQPVGRARWPYDHLGILTAPGHPEAGGYQTLNGTLVAGPERSGGHREDVG